MEFGNILKLLQNIKKTLKDIKLCEYGAFSSNTMEKILRETDSDVETPFNMVQFLIVFHVKPGRPD